MKPASVTPLTAVHLTRLLEEAGVPAGVVNLVLGPGARVGQALADSPDVDLMSLTGGIEAGRALMRGAAGNVKKVALELGGKSPNIVFADADFETAVDNALTAAFTHSGQVCSAGCRAIVEDGIYDRFVAEVGRRADLIRLGIGLDDATEAGALITAEHRAGSRATSRPRSRRAPGSWPAAAARRSRSSRPASSTARRCSPTSTATMRIIREEVFGPVLTIERFTTEDEAIELGNDTTYGLAGAVWTADPSARSASRRASATARSGSTTTTRTCPEAEWGGFKQSGIGRELGPSGLDEYREAKHIWQNTAPGPTGWFGG